MTYLDETRYHWFSLDSAADLSLVALELSTDDGATWTLAQHATAPASAASYPPPEDGQTRYWWRALFGPALALRLSSVEQVVEGRLTSGDETLRPTWTVYSEATPPDDCWPVDTGCLGDTWDGVPADVQARAAMLAVETLRSLTGYRVGSCPITVRPCAQGCVQAIPLAMGHVGPAWSATLDSGRWINNGCRCSSGSCSCAALSEVRLPGGIARVVEVMVDGAVLDPTAYAVHNGTILVSYGDPWPRCQDMTLPTTDVGTFAVTYVPGVSPGPMGQVAAGVLAGEYAKACQGQACALPARVTSIVRQGVSMSLGDGTGDLFPGGLTGIREVDAFVKRHNPHALKSPSAVLFPRPGHRYVSGGPS